MTVDLLFERFVSAERQRAARHRRRFRARAARGGDPAHLREIWPRARRPCRHGDLLSRPQRHPRRRQGVRPVGGHHRRARQHAVGLVDERRDGQGGAPRRARSGRSAAEAGDGAGRGTDRHAAPSVPACRRLCHHAQPARRSGADRERGDGRPHRHRMGEGRSRSARAAQGRCAGARHADVPAALLRFPAIALRRVARSVDAGRGRSALTP